jgi:hypothetical protein
MHKHLENGSRHNHIRYFDFLFNELSSVCPYSLIIMVGNFPSISYKYLIILPILKTILVCIKVSFMLNIVECEKTHIVIQQSKSLVLFT